MQKSPNQIKQLYSNQSLNPKPKSHKIQLLIKMNNNPRAMRSSSQTESHKSSAIGTRHSSIATPNNNIHININLNVKKKSHCYHPQTIQGKKINNYFELSDMKNDNVVPIEEVEGARTTAVGRQKFLLTKPEGIKNQQKPKMKKTKQKEKTASKPFTPEKHFKPQSEQKSLEKSRTNKKLAKKKQSKSMQNIKVFKQKPLHLQQTKHHLHQNKNPMQQTKKPNNYLNPQKEKTKFKSRSNSSSKQRSRQKSGQKLKKMRSSSKNIVSFQNSGIKKILGSQKQSGKKNQAIQNMRKSKKSLKVNKMAQRDMIKINQFMQQNKKQEQRKKKQHEQSAKDVKKKDEILKRSKKEFYTKPEKASIPHSISEYKKRSKFPMFYGEEEDNNDEDDSHNGYNRNINKHSRPQHKTPQKTRPYPKHISPQNPKKSSGKKHRECLVEKYINGDISKVEKKQLKKKVITIQAFWRGYWLRKNLMQEIGKMAKVTTHKKRLIHEKKSQFWDDDENNSIINLDNDQKQHHKHQRMAQHKISHNHPYKTPQNSNYNSSQTPTEQNHTNKKKYQSQSGHQNEFLQSDSHEKRLNVSEFKKNVQKLQNSKNSRQDNNRPSEDSQNSSLLASQIQMLKRQIQEQNRKFMQLQLENSELRLNLKSIVVKKQKQKQKESIKHFDLHSNSNTNTQPISPIDIDNDSVLIYQLNRGQFAGQNFSEISKESKELKQDSKKNQKKKFKSLKIQTHQQLLPQQQFPSTQPTSYSTPQSPSNPYVQTLKRQLQTFQSPSNRSLKSAQLSNLKNLHQAFKKKQLSIDATYQKNAIMYHQMLQNNIVSPRTYSFKKVELEERYKKQKEEITKKYEQAEKVIRYISEEIVMEEGVGEDQSPKKVNVEESQKEEKGKKFKKQGLKENTQLEGDIKHSQPFNKPTAQLTNQQLAREIQSYTDSNLSLSPNTYQSSNFRKYWTDDMQQVHKKVLQISNKIDEALQADSKYSQSMKSDENRQYSSQNSNFHSLNSNSNRSEEVEARKEVREIRKNEFIGDEMTSPIFQETQYKISEPQEKQLHQNTIEQPQQQQQQQQQVLGNTSNVSSTSSTRNLQLYNIHYPSSPKSQKPQPTPHPKHNFQIRNQNYQQPQNTLQNNTSQLSQNRSSLSSASHKSTTHPHKGFDTRLTFIKEYCIALCEFIRSQQQLKTAFVSNISKPLRYDYFELLKSYRTTMNNQNDTKYNSTLEDYVYPYFRLLKGSLGERGLNEKNTKKFQQLYEQNYEISKELTPQMRQIRKFFVQAIIDVFNESLDFQRPGSIYGQPLPWLVQSKNLKNNQVKFLSQPQPHNKRLHKPPQSSHAAQHQQQSSSNQSTQQDERLDKIFGVAIAKIIQWGSCLCGFIPQPVSFDGQDAQAVNIDDEQTNLVRETRLAYMLEKSLAQDEEKMVDNTMEQLEVQLEVQQMILYELVTEMVEQLIKMESR